MYERFFGLSEQPFSIAPNPRYLYMSDQHHEALAHLIYGVKQEGGFIVLTGEVGTGKTTVCRCFLEQLSDDCDVAFILNSKLSKEELLETLCDEFQADYSAKKGASIKHYTDAINRYLLDAHARKRKSLLIIDEAQNLSVEVLEQIRLLTNLETNQKKLLQIILIGQPELRSLFEKYELRQLDQRVTARYHLSHLSLLETVEYVRHRLQVAGCERKLFSDHVIKKLHHYTGGIPRLINVVCDRALLSAYVKQQDVVTLPLLKQAKQEVFGMHRQRGFIERGAIGSTQNFRLKTKLTISLLLLFFSISLFLLNKRFSFVEPPLTNIEQHEDLLDQGEEASSPEFVSTARDPLVDELGFSETIVYPDPAVTGGAESSVAVSIGDSVESSNTQLGALSNSGNQEVGGIGASTEPHMNSANSDSKVLSKHDPRLSDELPWTSQELFDFSQNKASEILLSVWGKPGGPVRRTPCKTASLNGLSCISKNGDIDDLLQINRPAILTMQSPGVDEYSITLIGYNSDLFIVKTPNGEAQLTLELLDEHWTGDFLVFWKPHESFYGAIVPGTIGPEVRWLSKRLGRAMEDDTLINGQISFDDNLVSAVKAYQRSQGLTVDGIVGAQTLMALNSSLREDFPSLHVP